MGDKKKNTEEGREGDKGTEKWNSRVNGALFNATEREKEGEVEK
jgi:hypothetical protein